MKVSIILPTYNGSRFIARAIESVLHQSFQDYEFIIIDDGSYDSTAAVIQKYANKDKRIRSYRDENNQGIITALNHGLSLAKGEYIARIDDDDIWIDRDKLKNQVQFLDSHQDHVLVGTGYNIGDETGNEIHRHIVMEFDEAIRKRILWAGDILHTTVMYRRNVVLKLGGYRYDKRVLHFEDYDLWLRLANIGKLATIPNQAVLVTIRNKSVSASNAIRALFNAIYITYKYGKSFDHYYYSIFRRGLDFMLYGVMRISPYSHSKMAISRVIRKIIPNFI